MSPPTHAERALALAEQHVEAATYMTADERFEDAHAQWLLAAEHYDEANDVPGRQVAWMKAGLCSQRLGASERALNELTRAVELARAPGLERALAVTLSHLAGHVAREGREQDAKEAWHEALALATTLNEAPLVSAIASNLARLQLERGDLNGAEAAFLRAKDAATLSDDLAGLASADNALGEIARQRGDHDRARELFEAAFDASHQAGDAALMGLTLNNLGNAYRQLGDLERAANRFNAALAFANVTGDAIAVARTHTNLGNIAAARGQLDDAQRHYTQALSLDKKHHQHQATLGNLVNLANIRATRGDFLGARKFYEEALAKLPPEAHRTLADLETMLGQLEARMGHLDRAESLFTSALVRAKKAAYEAAIARLTMNLAALAHARGHLIAALDGYRSAVGLIDRHGSPSDRIMAHLVVADAALARAQHDLAEAAATQARLRLDAMRPTDSYEEEEAPLREALDVDAMRARVDFAKAPSATTRDAMIACAERLMNAGRTADALGHWLTLLDDDDPTDHADRVRENLAWAEKQPAEPLTLEYRSLAALASNAPPEDLVPLSERATELGLALVALRIERRRARALLVAGRQNEAIALIQGLIPSAKKLGADAEAARLEALAR